MPNRLLRAFGRKPDPEPTANPADRSANGTAASAPSRLVAPPTNQIAAALSLAQELLRGIEHFILSTPDLDTPGFLERVRRTAASLTPATGSEELETHRRWAADSLSAFGQLQRRYLSEREGELWRLLNLYQDHQKVDGATNKQFHEALRGTHERMANLVRLDDLRQVRERLENEINRAGALLEQKARQDEERAAALAVQVQALEAALVSARHEAMMDQMTGVFHRGGFQEHLEAALHSPVQCSLAMVDVDNFKGVNDTLGHLVGDHILKVAVQLLSKIARPGDVIGRYGGDEFCLLAPGIPPNRLSDRFDVLASQRTVTFQFDGRLCSVRLSFSVGITASQPGDTVETIMARADGALYEVKRNGKGHARIAEASGTFAA